jgi:hypothetical protein
MRPPGFIASALIGIAIFLPAAATAQWVSNGTPVCTATGVQADAVALADGAGGCFIAWDDARSGSPKIWAQHLDATGNATWAANGINVCNQAGSETLPQIVTDAAGGCIIVWQDTRSIPSMVYAQRLSGSGAAQWAGAGVALTSATSRQTMVVAAPDGAGGVIAAWLDSLAAYEIHAQRLGASGARLWNAAGVRALPASSSGVGSYTGPRIDSDGSGGALITGAVTGAPQSLEESRALGQRISAAGAPLWTTDGRVLNVPVTYYLYPNGAAVLGDGSGGGYFATISSWSPSNGPGEASKTAAFCKRVDSAGLNSPGWQAGASASNALGRPYALTEQRGQLPTEVRVLPDGVGGAIFVAACTNGWTDLLPSYEGTIIAQHVTSTGVPYWGQAVEAPSWDVNVSPGSWRAVPDGSGGVIVAWNGASGDGLYAVRLDHGGVAAGWMGAGVLLVDGTAGPVVSSMCGGDASGAIVVYGRGGDVYAVLVSPGGVVVGVGPSPVVAQPGLELQGVSPNPTRHAVRVVFTLAEAGETRIEVFDVLGRRLVTRDAGRLPAGPHGMEVASVALLTGGVYEIRLTSGGASRSARFVVLH